jgi:deoxycytidylate deaminase
MQRPALTLDEVKTYMHRAHEYAIGRSGCTKVQVGCVIVTDTDAIFGANFSVPPLCKTHRGCLRVELYGNDSKNHRLPGDCRAVHSEVDAICHAAQWGKPLLGGVAIITRYPCEACARALVMAGIREVYYGRQQEISDQTKEIFAWGDVSCTWVKDFEAEDVFT